MMKKYDVPNFELILIANNDVLTTSGLASEQGDVLFDARSLQNR